MSLRLNINANFRVGAELPSLEAQYRDLWRLALFLETIGLPLSDWCPPADTPENARLNAAFDARGPTTAALALAGADKENRRSDLRTLGVWNGKEDAGGIVLTTLYNTSRIPSNLHLTQENVASLNGCDTITQLVFALVEIWRPMLVKVTPGGYDEHMIFQDRPPVGWMIYLPFEVTAMQVPEAAKIIPFVDHKKKLVNGTLIVSTLDVFDVKNTEHIERANAIETRLVDQDLLPTLREFLTKY